MKQNIFEIIYSIVQKNSMWVFIFVKITQSLVERKSTVRAEMRKRTQTTLFQGTLGCNKRRGRAVNHGCNSANMYVSSAREFEHWRPPEPQTVLILTTLSELWFNSLTQCRKADMWLPDTEEWLFSEKMSSSSSSFTPTAPVRLHSTACMSILMTAGFIELRMNITGIALLIHAILTPRLWCLISLQL